MNISIPTAALEQAWSQSNKSKLRTTFLYYKGGELFLSKQKVDGVQKQKSFCFDISVKISKITPHLQRNKRDKKLLHLIYFRQRYSWKTVNIPCQTKTELHFEEPVEQYGITAIILFVSSGAVRNKSRTNRKERMRWHITVFSCLHFSNTSPQWGKLLNLIVTFFTINRFHVICASSVPQIASNSLRLKWWKIKRRLREQAQTAVSNIRFHHRNETAN